MKVRRRGRLPGQLPRGMSFLGAVAASRITVFWKQNVSIARCSSNSINLHNLPADAGRNALRRTGTNGARDSRTRTRRIAPLDPRTLSNLSFFLSLFLLEARCTYDARCCCNDAHEFRSHSSIEGEVPRLISPVEYFRRVTSREPIRLARSQLLCRTINHIHTHATQLARASTRGIIISDEAAAAVATRPRALRKSRFANASSMVSCVSLFL